MSVFTEYLISRVFEPSMLLQNLVTIGDIIILLGDYQKIKENKCRAGTEYLLLFVGLLILNGMWEILFHSPGSYFVTHILLLVGYAALCRCLQRKPYIITIVLFYAVEIGMITLSSIFPTLLGARANGWIIEIVLRNIIVFLTVPAAVFFRRFGILEFKNLTNISVIYSILIGSTTTILSLIYFTNKGNYNIYGDFFAIGAFLSILLINFVAYYLNYAMCKYGENEKQLLIENYSFQKYQDMLRLNQQNLEDMRKIRHDMKNHFACINVLLSQKKFEDAVKYFDILQENKMVLLSYIDCGNQNISAILNLETAKARTYGIHIDYRVIAASQLPIAEDDLCALMTNLIDNAIEASARDKIQNAVVEVGINQKDLMLYICVVNPVDISVGERELLSLKTTKENRNMHGYGHKIVDDIVQKYNGMLNRTIRNGKYIVDVSINIGQI